MPKSSNASQPFRQPAPTRLDRPDLAPHQLPRARAPPRRQNESFLRGPAPRHPAPHQARQLPHQNRTSDFRPPNVMTSERSSRGSPVSHMQKSEPPGGDVRTAPRETLDSATSEAPSDFQSSDYDKQRNRGRFDKDLRKGRGSLLAQDDTVRHDARRPLQTAKRPFRRPHALLAKHVSPDVYIPSVVSVGALAQLLNVRLGSFRLIFSDLVY